MLHRIKRQVLPCLWLLSLLTVVSCRAAEPQAQPRSASLAVLESFKGRVAVAREDVPQIIKAAEAAAERMVSKPDALINVPYAPQPSFAEEIVNRSGGLAAALPPEERWRETTDHDVLLFSVRSWEKDGPKTPDVLKDARKRGWLIVLFASKAGAPKDLDVDYLVDNGASTGGASEAPMNAITNCLNAWVWHCEYAAALTRRGKCPGILKSIALPDGAQYDAPLQTRRGRHWMGECNTPIEPGKLADAYLKRVDELVAALGGERTQGQIGKAADIIAERMTAGRTVGVATCTHVLMSEIFLDTRSPWKPFNVVWHAKAAFPENVKKGDLLVWFGYIGVSTVLEDYNRYMRETGADVVTCFVRDENESNNAPEALAHIDQSWVRGDAEVAIPFAPGRMAPVSGLDQGLLFRMLDAAVAARIGRAKATRE